MIKNMTMFEKNAPTPTSMFLRSSSWDVAPLRRASVLWPADFSSSTSSLVCQKNKFEKQIHEMLRTSGAGGVWFDAGFAGSLHHGCSGLLAGHQSVLG
jgi:hypothetical protein